MLKLTASVPRVESSWGRFAEKGQRDGSGDGVHGLAGAAFVPLREHPKQQRQGAEADGAHVQQLSERAEVETGTRRASREVWTWRIGDLGHDAEPGYDTMRSRLPTMRFRCMSELHSSAWWT